MQQPVDRSLVSDNVRSYWDNLCIDIKSSNLDAENTWKSIKSSYEEEGR